MDGHRPELRLERHLDRAVGFLLRHRDLGVGEGGNVLGHPVGQRKLALLDQDHGRHARDRFGHRGDAEDRVGRHRRLGFLVAEAEGVEHGDPAVARDQNDGARQFVVLDPLLDPVAESFQALADKANFFRRLGLGNSLRCGGNRDSQCRNSGNRPNQHELASSPFDWNASKHGRRQPIK